MDDGFPHKLPEVAPAVPNFTPQTLTIVSLCVALCLLILVIFTKRKSSTRGNSLLLVGPPDSGKTAILFSLIHKQTLPTHTSLQTNSSIFVSSISKKTLRVVDVPGHPRIRDQFLEHLPDAKAVAFVVDASTISRNGAAVAEHLHNVLHALTSLPPSQELPELLILAHKADLLKTGSSTGSPKTFAVTRVKTVLERELENRRLSQSDVNVEGLGAEGEKSELGGLECSGAGGAFKFDEWEGGKVTFMGTSIKTSKDGFVNEKDEVDADDGLSLLGDWLHENL